MAFPDVDQLPTPYDCRSSDKHVVGRTVHDQAHAGRSVYGLDATVMSKLPGHTKLTRAEKDADREKRFANLSSAERFVFTGPQSIFKGDGFTSKLTASLKDWERFNPPREHQQPGTMQVLDGEESEAKCLLVTVQRFFEWQLHAAEVMWADEVEQAGYRTHNKKPKMKFAYGKSIEEVRRNLDWTKT